MADRVSRKLHYGREPVTKTWPDREDLSEAEPRARAAGWPEEAGEPAAPAASEGAEPGEGEAVEGDEEARADPGSA